MNKIYFWKCPQCKIDYVVIDGTFLDAMKEADAHDKEIHKGKPITHFGWKT